MSTHRVASSHLVVPALALSVLVTLSLSSVAAGQTMGIREVTASARSMIPLQTRLRYTTMIVLPDGELHEYLCSGCGSSVGSRRVTAALPAILVGS